MQILPFHPAGRPLQAWAICASGPHAALQQGRPSRTPDRAGCLQDADNCRSNRCRCLGRPQIRLVVMGRPRASEGQQHHEPASGASETLLVVLDDHFAHIYSVCLSSPQFTLFLCRSHQGGGLLKRLGEVARLQRSSHSPARAVFDKNAGRT